MAQVLVAKRDLPVGTQLKAGDMGWQPWPAATLNAAYTTNGANPAPAPDNAVKKAATTSRPPPSAPTPWNRSTAPSSKSR